VKGLIRHLLLLRDWAGDTSRFFWALGYWNLRKSVYMLRRRRGHCPCQDPSDAGGGTRLAHCDASVLWNDPARFRRVCPLLQHGPEGWRCTVGPQQVRPFWGRALGCYGALLCAVYLTGVTAAFGLRRARGDHDLAWADVAWPGRWHNIKRAQSRNFLAQAVAAIGRQDFRLAQLALNSATEINPNDYETAALLTMLEQYRLPSAAAEAAYNELARRFPALQVRSAITFHDVLLATGRTEHLAEFSLRMMVEHPPEAGIWLRSMIVGLRQTRDPSRLITRHQADIAKLGVPAQFLLQAESLMERNQFGPARLMLARPAAPPTQPIYALIQIEMLLRLGDWATAVTMKNRAAAVLGNFKSLALEYWIEKSAGNDSFARLCSGKLVANAHSPAEVEWLAAMLVHAPDREFLSRLDQRLSGRPATVTPGDGAAMWMAAVVCGDRSTAARWAGWLKTHANIAVPDFVELDYTSSDFRNRASVPFLIGMLPLPREVIFALCARMNVSGASR
jgi:hypothetical protein